MGGPLWFCFVAFFIFFLLLMNLRVRLERQRATVEAHFLNEDES